MNELAPTPHGTHVLQRPTPRRAPLYPPCKNCAWYRHHTPVVSAFRELGVVFDVALAERAARESGRAPVTFSWRRLRHYVSKDGVNTRHVAHVDRSKPGVMGTLRFKGRRRLVLIEGSHRAFGSVRDRESYNLHLLTEEETARCLR